MRNFLFIIVSITVLIAVGGYVVFSKFWPEFYTPALPVALLTIVSATTIAHYFLIKAVKKTSQRDFNNMFLSVTGVKLMLYLFGIVTYVVFNIEKIKSTKVFLVSFLAMYFIYTVVEIFSIMSFVKRKRADGN